MKKTYVECRSGTAVRERRTLWLSVAKVIKKGANSRRLVENIKRERVV